MAIPASFLAVLWALTAYEAATGYCAVLVGGAAVVLHTQGAFMSGDFDVHAPNEVSSDLALLGTRNEDGS